MNIILMIRFPLLINRDFHILTLDTVNYLDTRSICFDCRYPTVQHFFCHMGIILFKTFCNFHVHVIIVKFGRRKLAALELTGI